MLSIEYLIEEAKDTGLPTTKRRAILREYTQSIILNSIYKNRIGKHMYFRCGTALRYCYRLPRFSEDLNFNTEKISDNKFQEIIKNTIKNIEYEGLNADYTINERGRLKTAEINFPEIMQQYNITDARGIDLMVKVEVNQPGWKLSTKPHVLSHYGFNYTATIMAESALITEKLLAMMNRTRGRDIYDLIYMLKKKFPFDTAILKANNIKEKPEKLIINRLENFPKKELERLAKQVKPFLFREDDLEPVIKALEYAKKYLENQSRHSS